MSYSVKFIPPVKWTRPASDIFLSSVVLISSIYFPPLVTTGPADATQPIRHVLFLLFLSLFFIFNFTHTPLERWAQTVSGGFMFMGCLLIAAPSFSLRSETGADVHEWRAEQSNAMENISNKSNLNKEGKKEDTMERVQADWGKTEEKTSIKAKNPPPNHHLFA